MHLVKQHYQTIAVDYYNALSSVNDDLGDLLSATIEFCDVATAFIIIENDEQQYVLGPDKLIVKKFLEATLIKGCCTKDNTFRDSKFKATHFTPNSFYASFTLTNSIGVAIGCLCLINNREKQISTSEKKYLQCIALQIVKRCERALEITNLQRTIEKADTLLYSVLNTNPDYLILLNDQLEITAYNNCASNFTRHFTGSKLEKGTKIINYISSEFAEEFGNLCKNAFNGEKVCYEHFVNKKPYENTWFCFTISPIHTNTSEIIGLIVTGTNINEQKKQEKTIKHQSDSLSIIAQLQSHQVRQPVTSILGLMSLIKEDNYIPQQEYLIGLEKATNQLDEVIQTIVSQSRRV
jgi:hypothetical protein